MESEGNHAENSRSMLERVNGALSPDLRRELDGIWRSRSVAAGAVLIEEGGEASEIGYVTKGLLAMVKVLADGRRHNIGLLAPTDMYGRAFDCGPGYRVEALTDSTVHVCDRAAFEDILGRSPEAERLFLTNLQDEIAAAREWVMVLNGPKIVQRLASFLFILCRRKYGTADATGPDGAINLHIAIRRAILAHYLGARTESLSRAFRELKQGGIIRINDPYNFDVLDLPRLIEAAGHDLALPGGTG